MPMLPPSEELDRQSKRSITKMSTAAAIEHVCQLIDSAFDASFERGAKRALFLLDKISKRELPDAEGALVEYFRANAWAACSKANNVRQSRSWEATEFQKELLALSRASNHPGFVSLNKVRQCQILTNHANLLNIVGRSIDAIAVWDAALKIFPEFAMARGNRGGGLKRYAGMVVDDRDRAILALHAFDDLRATSAEDSIYESVGAQAAQAHFAHQAEELSQALDIDSVRAMQDLDSGDKGRSKVERAYRRWCLERRLYLSSLNELGPHFAAATDDLTLPPLTEGFNNRPDSYLPPPIVGLFNQMKQEYVSARFLLFEGMRSTRVHFSDRSVKLIDTLDYPLYSLASEQVRTAFRIAYSLLDKIAFLVDHYWSLDKRPDRISFKNVWMIENKARLLPQLEKLDNLPLRGLFWLSKELFDDQLKLTIAADARELHSIRNALEHTYLRVSEGWAKPFAIDKTYPSGFGIAMGSDELEAKAVRIMQMARSALFYVSFAIGVEERKKQLEKPGQHAVTMPLYELEEGRKRRDPI